MKRKELKSLLMEEQQELINLLGKNAAHTPEDPETYADGMLKYFDEEKQLSKLLELTQDEVRQYLRSR